MSQMTVQQFAESVGTPVDRLIGQLKEAGVEVEGPAAKVTDAEKLRLLEHLRQAHGVGDKSEAGRMTLKRRATTQTLKVTAGQGRTKTVNVEVRKRRQIVRKAPEPEVAPEPVTARAEPVPETPPGPGAGDPGSGGGTGSACRRAGARTRGRARCRTGA